MWRKMQGKCEGKCKENVRKVNVRKTVRKVRSSEMWGKMWEISTLFFLTLSLHYVQEIPHMDAGNWPLSSHGNVRKILRKTSVLFQHIDSSHRDWKNPHICEEKWEENFPYSTHFFTISTHWCFITINCVENGYFSTMKCWDNKPIIPKKTQQTDLMFTEQFNLPLRVPQLWEAVRRKNGTTASWPDWSARSEAHHHGAGTRKETTWSTTEGEKQPSGGVRLRDCLSSSFKQGMQSALRGWWLFGADEGEDEESPERFRGGVY